MTVHSPSATSPAPAAPYALGRTALPIVLLLAGAAGAALAPSPAAAQSLLGVGGLGFPHETLTARARGIGSAGVGLGGSSLLPADPAAAAGIPVPVLGASYQPSWSSYELEGVARELTASRFPLIGIAYPVGGGGGAVSLTFSSYLDQNWVVEEESTLDLSGGETLDVLDRFRSEGGVSVLRLGWAQPLGEDLAVGLNVGTYLGEVRRSMTRFFQVDTLETPVSPYRTGAHWRFSGPTVTAGAVWDPSELVRVAGSATWSGDLHAEPEDGTSIERDVSLPVELRMGVTGSLSPRLSAHVGAEYADWGPTGDDLRGSRTVGAAWGYGGGLEWEGPALFGRDLPLRIGYRHRDLPFVFDGADPTENSLSLGLGLNILVSNQGVPLASIDAAYEFGDREAGAFSESFGRATFTIQVAGQ